MSQRVIYIFVSGQSRRALVDTETNEIVKWIDPPTKPQDPDTPRQEPGKPPPPVPEQHRREEVGSPRSTSAEASPAPSPEAAPKQGSVTAGSSVPQPPQTGPPTLSRYGLAREDVARLERLNEKLDEISLGVVVTIASIVIFVAVEATWHELLASVRGVRE